MRASDATMIGAESPIFGEVEMRDPPAMVGPCLGRKPYGGEADAAADTAGDWLLGGRAEEAELAAASTAVMTSAGGWTYPRMRRAAVFVAMTYVSATVMAAASRKTAAAACTFSALVFNLFLWRPQFSVSMALISGVSYFFGFRKALMGASKAVMVSAAGTGVVSSAAAAPTIGFRGRRRESKGKE